MLLLVILTYRKSKRMSKQVKWMIILLLHAE